LPAKKIASSTFHKVELAEVQQNRAIMRCLKKISLKASTEKYCLNHGFLGLGDNLIFAGHKTARKIKYKHLN
jgi:hypothetical protein